MKEYKRPEKLTDDEILQALFRGAKEVFGNGIYIATFNHECGYDFLSFEYLEDWTDLRCNKIGYNGYELNDGKYYSAHESDKYLIDVLNENDWKFEFERESIQW